MIYFGHALKLVQSSFPKSFSRESAKHGMGITTERAYRRMSNERQDLMLMFVNPVWTFHFRTNRQAQGRVGSYCLSSQVWGQKASSNIYEQHGGVSCKNASHHKATRPRYLIRHTDRMWTESKIEPKRANGGPKGTKRESQREPKESPKLSTNRTTKIIAEMTSHPKRKK